MSVTAIIPAAGSGSRMKNGKTEKQFQNISGKPMIEWTIETISNCKSIEKIIIVVPNKKIESLKQQFSKFSKVTNIVAGGIKRNDSVYNGILASTSDIVVIHDAARPCVSPALIDKTVRASLAYGAATSAIPAVDTIKLMNGNFIGESIDREKTLLIQTPQAFNRKLLLEAYEKSRKTTIEWTDETSMLTALSIPVAWVEGESINIKITTPKDLLFASAYLSNINKD